MKPATLLALPALALAAATPAKVEERQDLDLPALPINLDCVLRITNIATCVNLNNPTNLPSVLSDLVGCPVGIIVQALFCVIGGLPAKN
ncbi:hypothetical protein LRP88_11224 [Fusarium phalaenopsidis]